MATKQYTIYRLHFSAPLHIGDTRDDYGISLKSIASDSLYAAMTAVLAQLGKPVPSDGYLGCVISSLFPYKQSSCDSELDYYFPKPQNVRYAHLSPEEFKQAKKMQWLNLHMFEQAINGVPIQICDNPDFIKSEVSERVQVSRDYSEDSMPFYMDRLYFEGNSGLFFLAEGDTSIIDQVLPLLSIDGIGTDRNVGNGSFDFQKDSISIRVPDDAEYGVSLSAFIPENMEQLNSLLSSEGCTFELKRIGGWITSAPYNSLRKNAIYAFAAGSVLYGIKTGNGRIVDLAPKGLVPHPIWRCGKTLVIPTK